MDGVHRQASKGLRELGGVDVAPPAADHHAVPGKKQWVWGCGAFGRTSLNSIVFCPLVHVTTVLKGIFTPPTLYEPAGGVSGRSCKCRQP